MNWFWDWIAGKLQARLPATPVPAKKIDPSMSADELAAAFASIKEGEEYFGAERASVFKIPKPMPGVLPKGELAMDSVPGINTPYAYAAMNQFFSEGLQFMGYQYLAELTQRAEYRRPAEIIAKEMTRKWIKLKAKSDEDKSAKIEAINAELKRLNAESVFRKAVELDAYFGRSQIFLDLGEDTDDDEGRKELATPLVLSRAKIGEGLLKRLTIVEPMWTYPNDYNSDNPLNPTFYRAQSWFVMGMKVHATRLLTIIGRPVPDLLKAAYMFGGLSLSQMAKPYVDNWLRTRQSVADLVHSYSVMGLKTNMGTNLNAGAMKNLINRIKIFNGQRDNRGVFLIDKNTEEFFNVSAPLTSLDSLQAQTQEHQSSVTGIPLSILLGITPSGLNASNDGEIRTFYQWVEAQQESSLRAPIKYVIDVIQISLFGEVDDDIIFEFEPLWAMSDKERAEIDKIHAETDEIRINSGVIDPLEARQRTAKEDDSEYSGLDMNKIIEPPDTGDFDDEGDLMGENHPLDSNNDEPSAKLNEEPIKTQKPSVPKASVPKPKVDKP